MIPVGRSPRRGSSFGKGRLLIALAVAAFSLISYYSSREHNPVTDEVQYVDMSPQQEVAIGLQAAPQMAEQHGGLHPDQEAQATIDRICARIVQSSAAKETPYKFDCHVLADEQTINAFALPGGQVFMTAGLLKRLQSEGQVAGVLGHEIGHVVARHGAEHMAKAKLTQGLTGAAVIASYDPNNPSSRNSAAVAVLIGQMVNMRFGREDEPRVGPPRCAVHGGVGVRPALDGAGDADPGGIGRPEPPAGVLQHPPEPRQPHRAHRAGDRRGVPAGRPQRPGELENASPAVIKRAPEGALYLLDS